MIVSLLKPPHAADLVDCVCFSSGTAESGPQPTPLDRHGALQTGGKAASSPPSCSHRALQNHTWLHSDTLKMVFTGSRSLKLVFLFFPLFSSPCNFVYLVTLAARVFTPHMAYSPVGAQASRFGWFLLFRFVFFPSWPGTSMRMFSLSTACARVVA